MRIRFPAVLSAALFLLTAAHATRVFAHGEAADEPFLKDLTVAFYDVHISPTTIKVGDPVTITGTRQNSRDLAVHARSAANRVHHAGGSRAGIRAG